MTIATFNDQVTDVQLGRYAKLIYKKTGIHVSPKKKMLLSNRVRRRMQATAIKSFEAYLQHLRDLPTNDPEWHAFLQEITTHETYLFRDETHWEWFRTSYLPEIASQARSGEREKSLRIWSAACSTGDEAYTIAACIADRLVNHSQWEIDILGTDIGVEAIKSARAATFSERAMQHVTDSYRRRFFTCEKQGTQWTAKSVLTSWTRFCQHNLLEPLSEPPFDLIFLKNVLIYFDRDSKRTVLAHICRALRPGGVLITGAAEGVSELLKDLKRVSPWMHCKPCTSETGTGKMGAASR